MFQNLEGHKIPDVTVKTRANDEWQEVTTADLFAGKNVIVFALPGAFPPTCSSSHLPRYEELVPTFKQHGIDEVICLSVNDAFVMEAWARDQAISQVRLLPDGNGALSKALGMLVDKSDLGFGPRSWRYSMLVRNGVIDKMFIEPDQPGDPFEVSDADTMLRHIAPDVSLPDDVTIITKPGCPHCARAKRTLVERGYAFEEVVLGRDATMRSVQAITGQKTVPQVFINGRHIGTADELELFVQGQRAA